MNLRRLAHALTSDPIAGHVVRDVEECMQSAGCGLDTEKLHHPLPSTSPDNENNAGGHINIRTSI